MVKITAQNAKEQREKLLAQLDDIHGGTATAVAEPDPEPVAQPEAEPEAINANREEAESDQDEATSDSDYREDEPEAEAEDRKAPGIHAKYQELEKKYTLMEKQFKALQAVTTPTQMENSKLRKEVDGLKQQLEESKAKPKAEAEAPKRDTRKRLEELRELLPEASDVFEDILERQERLESMREAEPRAQASTNNAAPDRDAAIASVLASVPNAGPIAENTEFWNWINSFEPAVADRMASAIKEPWKYLDEAGRPTQTIRIFQAFGDAPAPRPKKVQKPSDVAPNIRSGSNLPPKSGNSNNGVWTDKEFEAARRSLKGASREKAAEIRDQIIKQLRLAGQKV